MNHSKSSPGRTRVSASGLIDFFDEEKIPSPSRLRSPGEFELETDPGTIARRNKQVEYGKSTPEYINYITAVPKTDRAEFHPRTPNIRRKYSRRAWDGLIKQWRLNLHVWSDNPEPEIDLSQNGMIRKRRNNSNSSSASNSTSTTSSSNVIDDSEKDQFGSFSGGGTSNPRENKISKKSARLSNDIFSTSWADEVENHEFE